MSKASSRKHPLAASKTDSKRKILYALVAGSAIVIVFGVFSSQKKPLPPRFGYEGQPTAGQLSGAKVLVTNASYFDFGRIPMSGGKVSHSYSIRNSGNAPLTITKIYTSCMCTDATLITRQGEQGPFGMPGHGSIPTLAERLAPGETARVKVVFDPSAHGPAGIGLNERSVTIRNDAGRSLELSFTAMVRP